MVDVYVSLVCSHNIGLMFHLAPAIVAFACDIKREEFLAFAACSTVRSVAIRPTKMVLASNTTGLVCINVTTEKELIKIKQLAIDGRYLNAQTRPFIKVVHAARKFETIGQVLPMTKAYLQQDADSEELYESLHHVYKGDSTMLQDDQSTVLALLERVHDVCQIAKKRKCTADMIASLSHDIAHVEYLEGMQHHLARAREHKERTQPMMTAMMALI